MIHDETTEFSWDTVAYEHREKSTDWYWALGILVVVAAVIAFISRNFLFGFLLLMGGFMVGLFANKKPDHLNVEISTQGVKINGILMYFKDIKAFWIYRNMFGVRKLVLKTNRNMNPVIGVPIPDDIKASELREFLLDYVLEQELQESFTDLLIEKIGF